MLIKQAIFLLCILLVECKSVAKNDDSEHHEIPEEKTASEEVVNEERPKRAILEPWLIYDSVERELYKRSAEERDWHANYKAVQRNLLLSFLRNRRNVQNLNADSNADTSGKEINTNGKHGLNKRQVGYFGADRFTGGNMFDPYMGRL